MRGARHFMALRRGAAFGALGTGRQIWNTAPLSSHRASQRHNSRRDNNWAVPPPALVVTPNSLHKSTEPAGNSHRHGSPLGGPFTTGRGIWGELVNWATGTGAHGRATRAPECPQIAPPTDGMGRDGAIARQL